MAKRRIGDAEIISKETNHDKLDASH